VVTLLGKRDGAKQHTKRKDGTENQTVTVWQLTAKASSLHWDNREFLWVTEENRKKGVPVFILCFVLLDRQFTAEQLITVSGLFTIHSLTTLFSGTSHSGRIHPGSFSGSFSLHQVLPGVFFPMPAEGANTLLTLVVCSTSGYLEYHSRPMNIRNK
jgi:hypothetical protein